MRAVVTSNMAIATRDLECECLPPREIRRASTSSEIACRVRTSEKPERGSFLLLILPRRCGITHAYCTHRAMQTRTRVTARRRLRINSGRYSEGEREEFVKKKKSSNVTDRAMPPPASPPILELKVVPLANTSRAFAHPLFFQRTVRKMFCSAATKAQSMISSTFGDRYSTLPHKCLTVF